ncbi:MAG: hypothetical protein IKU16_06005 [Muribaculaceae bacterium]|nr:hypothetical protein [Muribaculaceae bacterium]
MRIGLLVLLCTLTACNLEAVVNEPMPIKQATPDVSHRVDVIVDNQAEGVVFETDSVVLHYQEVGICKTFVTDASYIDSIVLNGELRTQHYPIYSGNILIPIGISLRDPINHIELMLYDGCPWYSADGNKVLQSIQFGEPNVEDWEEEE